jgi:hypothetical protein
MLTLTTFPVKVLTDRSLFAGAHQNHFHSTLNRESFSSSHQLSETTGFQIEGFLSVIISCTEAKFPESTSSATPHNSLNMTP